MILNENNIQAPFHYKISENTFELLKRNGELELNTNNIQIKVFEGQRLFCADIGYAVDGHLEEMEFLIDDIKVYPVLLEDLEDLQTVEVKDNEIYLIKEDINFKSIIFFPPSDLNKNFKFNITTYSSTFSSFMFDEIAKKLNTLDTNYPIINYYEGVDYKVNDIIKNNGYLYRVFKEFTSDSTDYYLKTNCNFLTPFKKLELDTDYKANELIEYNNDFLIVQKDFRYKNKDGVLTDLNGLLKPLQDIIIWFDGIDKIYKNQIIIKDGVYYIVLEDIENPVWGNIQKKIDYLNKASNTFYDDTNSGFGNNTNNVQNAIEKLKLGKQDSLTAGNNINLNGSNISVIGGTNKEYVTGNNYYIDDLIIYDSKLYKVNENFTATDWSTDRAKLTLISTGGSGGATDAIDVSYDNSKTNLEYMSGYDFPKFKAEIPETIDFIAGEKQTISIKKIEDNYFMTFKMMYLFQASISLYLIQPDVNLYKTYSTINQFFQTVSENEENYYDALEGEIVWEEITNWEELKDNPDVILPDGSFNFDLVKTKPLEVQSQFKITNGINSVNSLIIKSEALEEIQPETYCVLTLNIKNRVLRNEDTNIFTSSFAFMTTQSVLDTYHFILEQDNNNVKLKGSYTLKEGAGNVIGFYSPIIENYFNVYSSDIQIKNTIGITSSSGKPLKFDIYKTSDAEIANGKPPYLLLLDYQDGSGIQVGDTITFNLTPDKNSSLDPIYSPVSNVQQAIEAIVLNRIYPIGSVYYQISEPDGTFDDNKSPENLFGGVWEIKHADESIVLRTEGTKSKVNRINGLQPYGMPNLNGTVSLRGIVDSSSGVFTKGGSFNMTVQGGQDYENGFFFNSKNQIKEYIDDLVMTNRLWRILERIA